MNTRWYKGRLATELLCNFQFTVDKKEFCQTHKKPATAKLIRRGETQYSKAVAGY